MSLLRSHQFILPYIHPGQIQLGLNLWGSPKKNVSIHRFIIKFTSWSSVASKIPKTYKFFKNKQIYFILLDSWRTKYELKRAVEKEAEVTRQKEQEVRDLQVSAHSSSFKWVFMTKLILARLHYPLIRMLAM